jgi:P27 family predicted phage terminase small subunit
MGKRGPKPKPKALDILDGNPSRRKNVPDDMDISPDLPAVMPAVVRSDPVASAEWERLTKAMPARLYTAADMVALSLYCMSWSMLIQAQREIDEFGVVMRSEIYTTCSETGERVLERVDHKKNPAVVIWKTATETLLKTGDRLGLNPGVRSRMGVPDRNEQPEAGRRFAGLINQG